MLIESLQNEKIKHLTKLLNDNRFRKKAEVFCVEGKQENQRALTFGFQPVEYFICEDLFQDTSPDKGRIHKITAKVYKKIAYRGSSEGIIGVYQTQNLTLNRFSPKKDSTIIVVEGAEKPGNIGAILRSCEAFGIDALVIADAKADLYNPNVIRSSVGCLFGMNVFQATNEELYDFLKNHQYQIFTTLMDDTTATIDQRDYTQKSAILFGTEHSGLSSFWRGKGQNTLIPMQGTIDSLNLSNAVAITCYETLRQKRK
ncbi:TrmH family RNA methyltransferase [Bergeyella sp. RCAD1439]|uniref:TrmH family RNA methyltransferase n=1 Tax=Bergeyella anatis TaxID=3113737 RepID=UPI002E186E49|nr:TrmH family RNA methyltransferase [Bergeyella sp. RCAD1439]